MEVIRYRMLTDLFLFSCSDHQNSSVEDCYQNHRHIQSADTENHPPTVCTVPSHTNRTLPTYAGLPLQMQTMELVAKADRAYGQSSHR